MPFAIVAPGLLAGTEIGETSNMNVIALAVGLGIAALAYWLGWPPFWSAIGALAAPVVVIAIGNLIVKRT